MKMIPLGLALALSGCLASTGPRISADATRTAVVVMDLQVDFVGPAARLPVDPSHVEPVIAGSNTLLDAARASETPVFVVANAFPADDTIANWFRDDAAIAGTPGAALDPRLRVDARPYLKSAPDAFSSAAFDRALREAGIGHIIVTGVFADQCVKQTIRGALNRGYQVTVVADAVGAADEADRLGALADLRALGVRVLSTAQARESLIPRG